MSAIRLILKKSWKHPNKKKAWPVSTIIQVNSILAHELLADKIAENYNGEYPPKGKMKMNLENLKPK